MQLQIERKVEVNDGAPKERDSLANEALELIFDSASEVSFDGFTDSDWQWINQAQPFGGVLLMFSWVFPTSIERLPTLLFIPIRYDKKVGVHSEFYDKVAAEISPFFWRKIHK